MLKQLIRRLIRGNRREEFELIQKLRRVNRLKRAGMFYTPPPKGQMTEARGGGESNVDKVALLLITGGIDEPSPPAFAEHAPDEVQKRFRAYDPDRLVSGYGSQWPNGDVAIQWSAGPSTLIPAGGDWERFFVEWVEDY